MSIKYDLFTNPPQEGEETPLLHARVISSKTLNINDLAKRLKEQTTFSPADIKGALQAISDGLFACLSDGENVYLEGIGTFSVSLKSRPVKNKDEIRSASVAFKSVNFRAAPELKERFRGVVIERKEGRKKWSIDEEKRLQRIIWYVEDYGSINQTVAAQINQCIRQKAKADLMKLESEGKIKAMRCGKRYVYVLKTDQTDGTSHPDQES